MKYKYHSDAMEVNTGPKNRSKTHTQGLTTESFPFVSIYLENQSETKESILRAESYMRSRLSPIGAANSPTIITDVNIIAINHSLRNARSRLKKMWRSGAPENGSRC